MLIPPLASTRLLGDVHVERAARHVGIADEARGDGVVEARRALELDLIEFEIGRAAAG